MTEAELKARQVAYSSNPSDEEIIAAIKGLIAETQAIAEAVTATKH